MLFWNKQREIEGLLARYREKAAECVEGFRRSIETYCATSDLDKLNEDVRRVHRAESQADDIRREIEVTMYSKALFPESRGDVLSLLEAMDQVPNQAETAGRMIVNQFIRIPEELHPRLRELIEVCMKCVGELFDASAKVFTDFANAAATVGKVDELESEADAIEAALIRQIFSGDLGALEKILLRDLVSTTSDICNRAEKAADVIRIIVAKRMV